MAGRIETIHLKAGMPTVDMALRRLSTELQRARSAGVAVLKLVHGYGSTGKGGRIRTALRAELTALQAGSEVGRVVFGESFSIFDAQTRDLLDRYPELRRDADLEASNPGMTLVELRRRGRGGGGT